jgi:hypothetical protein
VVQIERQLTRRSSEGFGGLLGVAQGSEQLPRFIIMEHGSTLADVPTICLVGKGITFDSGGISIKPAENMDERIVGVDLVAVTGLSAALVQTIVSEIGTDMAKFPSAKAFGSWLGLAPHNDISGGRVLRSRTRKVVNRAAQAFRMAAQSVSRTDSAFGAYFRRMRAKLGTPASDCRDGL